jgi:exosortase
MNHAEKQAAWSPSGGILRRELLWRGVILLALGALLYSGILNRLVHQWWNDDNFSHGFVVPFFTVYFVWQDRKRLAALPIAPSWLGLVVIAGAMLMLVVGVLGAELFLSRSSLVFLLGGLVIHFLGWAQFRAVFFPWAFLFLGIPIPAVLFNQIAFPLQLLASQIASSLLPLMGVPTLREGNVIHLPVMDLEVVEACSGIRSLVSLGTLAVIYGYFLERRIPNRVSLALSAIPIAVLANSLRVVGTGLLGTYWDPDKATGFFHSFSGWVLFLLSLMMLFGLHSAMRVLATRVLRRTA